MHVCELYCHVLAFQEKTCPTLKCNFKGLKTEFRAEIFMAELVGTLVSDTVKIFQIQ